MNARRFCAVLLTTVLTTVLAAVPAAVPAGGSTAAVSESPAWRRTFDGTIGGARFRVAVPARWNGTLVLFSHGYYPERYPVEDVALANRPPDRSQTEGWLLAHGYAMAASDYRGRTGFQVENALRDQIALLDWFGAKIGRPRRTVATGQSLGGAIAVLLAERNPHRFAGVATTCGEFDPNGTFNAQLDMSYAVRTLLAPGQDIDLVHARNPAGSATALGDAVRAAMETPQGLARIALAAALGNLPWWFSAHHPQPTDPADQILAQAMWLGSQMLFMGPTAREDLERHAGGNPSFNVGIDYRRQLNRSPQAERVRRAYRAAHLDLDTDLRALATGRRIAPDPAAVAYMYRFAVPSGRIRIPVVTLHTPSDGGVVADHQRWYAEQVRRHGDPGDLRQLYVDRGMHCAFSDAEEIVTLRALFERIETGHWPNLSNARLNAAASSLSSRYHKVLDITTFEDASMPPAFTTFKPTRPMRPSR